MTATMQQTTTMNMQSCSLEITGQPWAVIELELHWNSAYLRQGMSYQCRDTRFNQFFTDPLPTSWKFHINPFRNFCGKLLTDRQINIQTTTISLHILLGGGITIIADLELAHSVCYCSGDAWTLSKQVRILVMFFAIFIQWTLSPVRLSLVSLCL